MWQHRGRRAAWPAVAAVALALAAAGPARTAPPTADEGASPPRAADPGALGSRAGDQIARRPRTADQDAPAPVDLLTVATDFNNPIGIDYHAPSHRLAMSVNYSSGEPYNLELVDENGAKEQFSGASGWTDEVKIATVRDGPCTAGFAVGDLFTGTGEAGTVARIAFDGKRFWSSWVQLPGENGLMRGSLFQDRYCVVGGDLVVVTTAGGVWTIDASKRAKRLAQLDTHLEGLITVPDDPRYGPWAGKILIGAEDQKLLYSVGLDRKVESWSLGIAPEDIEIVLPNESFYGVDYGAHRLVRADAPQWADKIGDVVVAQESGQLDDVRWNADTKSFEVTSLVSVGQWEHVTFAPLQVVAPTNTPSPTSALPTATATATPPPTVTPTATPTPAPIYLPALPDIPCIPQHADVALVIDASTSMLADASPGRTKMQEALAAAGHFLDLLDLPEDRAAIAWFNVTAGVEQPLTGDRGLLGAALARIKNQEFTRIDLGLQRGAEALAPALGQPTRRPALVLLTDGRSNPVPPQMAVDAAAAARAEGITVYTIGLGPDADVPTLQEISGDPQLVYLAPTAGDLARIYARIAADLACAPVPAK